MNIHLHKIAFLLVGFLAYQGMYSQSDTLVITLQDSVLMANLHAQLTLTPEQTKIIDRIIAKDSEEIENLDQEHRRLARTEVQSDERDQKMAELRERKKSLKEMRELNLRLAMTPDQWNIYQEKIKPGVPAVIHMGMNHDRATCKVCIPK